jgi:hypothetical protein
MALKFQLFFRTINMHTVKYFTQLLFFNVIIFSQSIFFLLFIGYKHDCSYCDNVLSARENGSHVACSFMYKIICFAEVAIIHVL